MELSEQTCAQRIADNLKSREEFVASLFEAADNDQEHEEVIDPIDFLYSEFALDVEKVSIIKILLSTGGPGDWLECFYHERYGDLYRVVYHFNDWWDHADLQVDEDSALWRYADMIVTAVCVA